MRRAAVLACLILGASALSACSSWTTDLDARVIDARTHTPVSGASAHAWPTDHPGDGMTLAVNSDGRVHVPSIVFWRFGIGDPGLASPLTLHVEAPGFRPHEQEYIANYPAAVIALEPLDANPPSPAPQ